MVIKTEGEIQSFSFPIGKKEDIKETVDILMQYSEEQDFPFQMHLVTPEQFELLEEIYQMCIRDRHYEEPEVKEEEAEATA